MGKEDQEKGESSQNIQARAVKSYRRARWPFPDRSLL